MQSGLLTRSEGYMKVYLLFVTCKSGGYGPRPREVKRSGEVDAGHIALVETTPPGLPSCTALATPQTPHHRTATLVEKSSLPPAARPDSRWHGSRICRKARWYSKSRLGAAERLGVVVYSQLLLGVTKRAAGRIRPHA